MRVAQVRPPDPSVGAAWLCGGVVVLHVRGDVAAEDGRRDAAVDGEEVLEAVARSIDLAVETERALDACWG